MGVKEVRLAVDQEELRVFTQAILRDVRALERMLETDVIESGIRRIGLEQEMFLVDEVYRPAPIAVEALERIEDPRVTSEIGRFNLECNSEPLQFGGSCLRDMEEQISELLVVVREAVAGLAARPVLTGILPTLRKSDLSLDNMVPAQRYYALNEALTRLRGGPYVLDIKGTDELRASHDNVMLESCNSSFQVHFQVGPEEFARLYNIAIAVTAPVLASAVNSPIMLGRRLWHETRIAVFQQSIDTRQTMPDVRDIQPRVSFGRQWVNESVLEIFREDISRFKVILGREIDEDPLEALAEGRAPALKALQLFNSTIYRWNRACYGVGPDGKAHLRIENRVLPSGPTVQDEVANAAFWYGLVSALANRREDVRQRISFDDARTNFVASARLGLDAQLAWFDGESLGADELILERLLPLSRQGLEEGDIDEADIDRYLGTIRERVDRRVTGAKWSLKSLAGMGQEGTLEQRLAALVAATIARQEKDVPVSQWELARLEEGGSLRSSYLTVEQYMNTDLWTVNEEEPIELVAKLMDWNHIHHVPVEDKDHRLVGLVSMRPLFRYLASDDGRRVDRTIPVRDIMVRDLVTGTADMRTLDAIELMRTNRISCLPIVDGDRLVGLITEHDFLRVSGVLLENMLREQ